MDKISSFEKIVDEICSNEAKNLGCNISKDFKIMLTEFVHGIATNIVFQDLEAFAQHGKRTTIEKSDIMLLVRRSPALEKKLKEYLEKRNEN